MTLLVLLVGCGLLDGGTIEETCEDLPAGCGGGGDGGTGTVDPIDIAVDSVEPVYGDLAGGDSVLITGGPFAADAEVLFGTQAADVRTWRESELRVIAPPGATTGWVEVSVTTSAGAGSADQGYRYFRDATDQTGMVGFFEKVSQLGALASLGDKAYGQAGFISPEEDATWFDTIADGWDSCRRDWSPDLGWQPIDPGSSSLELVSTAGSDTLTLAWDAAEDLYNGVDGTGSLPADTLVAGSRWDIDSFGGTELPDFALAGVLELPDAFTLLSPDLDSTSLALGTSDLDFTWTADSSSDGLYMQLRLVDGGTGEALETVTCLVEDDGSFSVPGTAFTSWEAGKTLYIKVGRAIETFAVLPLNGADTRLVGGTAVVGAATTE